MKVSVVIPTYNCSRTIIKCANSLLNIDYPKSEMEIIFVDDGSTDNTKELLKQYAQKNNIIKFFEQTHKGPASARNIGINNASGDIIVFTDSDCIVPPDWIIKLVNKFNKDIGAVGGSLKPFSLDTTSEIFEQYRRDSLYGHEEHIIDALPSCNLAVKKEVLLKIKGFDESFKYPSSEDYDLCYRIRDAGYKILYDPSIAILHFHAQLWHLVFRRAYIHGKEGVKLRKKRNYSLNRDILSLLKIFILPFLVFAKYPLKLFLISYLYENIALYGRFIGILKYR